MHALERLRTLTQADFDAFAQLSGDDNPIHVDRAFAAATVFGRPVAHGAMLSAMLRALAAELHADRDVVAQNVMFPAPTFADEPMSFRAVLAGDHQVRCEAVRVADGAVTCSLELVLA